MGVSFAASGFNVMAYDNNLGLIEKFKEKKTPFKEKNLDKFLKKSFKKIEFVKNIETAVINTNISFLVLPTPVKADGKYSLDYIFNCLDMMIPSLNKKKNHNIVLTSTVMPESCNTKIIPYLKKKIQSSKINFFYSPEFISIGNIIDEFINPRLVLIGNNKNQNSILLQKIYQKVCGKNVKIFNSSIENIEIAKIAVNCTMTTRISLMNAFQMVCSKTKNSDIDSITEIIKIFFLNFDKGFNAGLPYGGPCLPRDNVAMGTYLRSKKIKNFIPKATDDTNNIIVSNLYRFIKNKKIKHLLVLGLSYKNDTPETTESCSIKLIKKISKHVRVTAYDENQNDMGDKFVEKLNKIKNLKQISKYRAIIIMKNKDYLKNIKIHNNTIIIDPWRIYKKKFFFKKNYFPIGAKFLDK